jgi:hypothetical protein
VHGAGLVGGPAPGRKFKVTGRFRGPPELQWSFHSLRDIFSDRSRQFPINRGGGGRVRNFFFGIFFFFNEVWGRGGGRGGRVTPKPEAQVARFLVGMFRNRFLEAGVDAKVSLDQAIDEKVSPKVSLDQAIDEKVSPKVSLDQKCHQKLCDLRNRESDQNLSVIKVAGNQKLCTNAY